MRLTASSRCWAFFFHQLGLLVVGLDQVHVTDDDAEEIVQIVRDALRHGADGGRAARVAEPALQVDQLAVDLHETELRLDARQGFIEIDGFRDIVDRADAEALDLALLGGAGGDENDRDGLRLEVRLQPLAHFNAVHFRHHDIEENQIGLVRGDEVQGFLAGIGGGHGHAFALELALEQLHVDRLVVHHEDLRCGHRRGQKRGERGLRVSARFRWGGKTTHALSTGWRLGFGGRP